MAVATDGGKSRLRRAAERDVDLILTRSPVNLANLITVARLLLVVPLIWLIATEHLQAAFWLFLAAGVSDAVDGYIAKRFNSRTALGAYLDPLADKTLLDGIYLALAWAGWLPAWLALLVLSRDIMIVVGVILIRRRNSLYRARPLVIGKINTFSQIVLVAGVLAHTGGLVDLGGLIALLIGAVAITTVLSGAGYIGQGVRAATKERAS
jgi:cardiolipin synthase